MVRPRAAIAGGIVSLALVLAGCTRNPSPAESVDFRRAALRFVGALTERDYAKAYSMTTKGFRAGTSREELRKSFEAAVPLDFGPIGPIEIGETTAHWPDRREADLGRVTVSVGGEVYSETVILVMALEDDEPRARAVEIGRP